MSFMWLIDGSSPSLDNRPNLHPAFLHYGCNALSASFVFPDCHASPMKLAFNAHALPFVPAHHPAPQSALHQPQRDVAVMSQRVDSRKADPSVVDLKVQVAVSGVPKSDFFLHFLAKDGQTTVTNQGLKLAVACQSQLPEHRQTLALRRGLQTQQLPQSGSTTLTHGDILIVNGRLPGGAPTVEDVFRTLKPGDLVVATLLGGRSERLIFRNCNDRYGLSIFDDADGQFNISLKPDMVTTIELQSLSPPVSQSVAPQSSDAADSAAPATPTTASGSASVGHNIGTVQAHLQDARTMMTTGGSLMQQCAIERTKAILKVVSSPVSPELLNAQIAHDSAADAILSGQGGAGFLEEIVTAQATLAGQADPMATPTATQLWGEPVISQTQPWTQVPVAEPSSSAVNSAEADVGTEDLEVFDNEVPVAPHAQTSPTETGPAQTSPAETGPEALPAPPTSGGHSHPSAPEQPKLTVKDLLLMSFYDILAVDPGATPAVVRKAYGKLALKYHPDKGGDPEVFKYLTMVKDVLIDYEKRARYDANGKAEFVGPFTSQSGPASSPSTAKPYEARIVFFALFYGN